MHLERRKKKSAVTMPFDISYANSCEDVFYYSDVQCVYLCTKAADRNVNKLYICKSEQREICQKISLK